MSSQSNYDLHHGQLQAFLDEHLGDRSGLRVLEAGAGSASRVRLGDAPHMTGIDISAGAIEKNDQLDEKIVGDIQVHPLPEKAYDVVICWDVLEHLERPGDAAERLFRSLKPGGLAIFALPVLWSIKGLVTRFTPFSFHVWFVKNLLGRDRKGTPGVDVGPFRTYLKRACTPGALQAMAPEYDMDVVYSDVYEGGQQERLRSRHKAFDLAFGAVGTLGRGLSLGQYDPNASDCYVVLQRRGA